MCGCRVIKRLVNACNKLSSLPSDKELCDPALHEITVWNLSIIFIRTIDLKVNSSYNSPAVKEYSVVVRQHEKLLYIYRRIVSSIFFVITKSLFVPAKLNTLFYIKVLNRTK